MRYVALTIFLSALAACASTTQRGQAQLGPGMTTTQVHGLLGDPDGRSFRESNEAWQYHDVVGFGQCEYMTAWFTAGVLHAVTSHRGSSVAGCGLGSNAVDWGQMPKPSIDVNVRVEP
jgi:hypothetical protein